MDTAYSPPAYHQDNGSYTDQGAADSLGSGSAAPMPVGAPNPRRARTGKPAWVETLDNAHVRRIVAGQLEVRAEELRGLGDYGTPERAANVDTATLLADVATKLREG